MHATFRCCAVQVVRPSTPVTPLRQFMMDATTRSTYTSIAPHLIDPISLQPGGAVKGCSNECRSILSNARCEIIEGNNKLAWMDMRRGYCHLCQEPFGVNAGMHISDREHTNLQLFLYIYAAYPRHDFLAAAAADFTAGQRADAGPSTDSKRDQMSAARSKRAPSTTGSPTMAVGSPLLFSSSSLADAGSVGSQGIQNARSPSGERVTDTPASMLANVTAPTRPRSSLSSSNLAQSRLERSLWNSRDVLADMRGVSPALHRFATDHRTTDQLHTVDDATRRTELEALLFYLTHAPHQALPRVLQGKSSFGFWYSGERAWKYEMTRLITQLFPPMSAGMMTNFTQKCWGRANEERLYDALQLQRIKSYYGWGPYASKEKKAFFVRQLLLELLLSEVRPELSETAKLLAAQAVRRMAFELIFLMSMDYMHRVQRVYELLGRPTVDDLRSLNLL